MTPTEQNNLGPLVVDARGRTYIGRYLREGLKYFVHSDGHDVYLRGVEG